MELAVSHAVRRPLWKVREKAEETVAPRAMTQAECRAQLKECEARLRQNECLFDLETEELLIDSRIYEYNALLCRHRYLMEMLRR